MIVRSCRAWLLVLSLTAGPVCASVIEIGDDGAVRAPAMIRMADAAFLTKPAISGQWAVQLGAYPTLELLQADWRDIAQRSADLLRNREVVHAETSVAGQRYLRLSVTGLDDVREARELCGQLHMRGRDCFIRREQR